MMINQLRMSGNCERRAPNKTLHRTVKSIGLFVRVAPLHYRTKNPLLLPAPELGVRVTGRLWQFISLLKMKTKHLINQRIKIGVSMDPLTRLKALQPGNSRKLALMGWVETQN